jgi:hypothetical protein
VCPPVSAELVGWWNFDDNVDDQSGMGNDGILIDAVYDTNVPPAIGGGKSLSFEFDTDSVEIPEDPSLDSDVFTLSLFFYDMGQEGAYERFTSRGGDVFETAINMYPGHGGIGQIAYYSPDESVGWRSTDVVPELETWQHLAYVSTGLDMSIYLDGELIHGPEPWIVAPSGLMRIGNRHNDVEGFYGLIDDVALWDEALSDADIETIAQVGVDAYLHGGGGDRLQPGDADMDLDFDQLDLVQVQIAGKYLTGAAATWGEGDWNGAPGGSPGAPPLGDGVFNQLDIISAVGAEVYLTGPYAATAPAVRGLDTGTSIPGELTVAGTLAGGGVWGPA